MDPKGNTEWDTSLREVASAGPLVPPQPSRHHQVSEALALSPDTVSGSLYLAALAAIRQGGTGNHLGFLTRDDERPTTHETATRPLQGKQVPCLGEFPSC